MTSLERPNNPATQISGMAKSFADTTPQNRTEIGKARAEFFSTMDRFQIERLKKWLATEATMPGGLAQTTPATLLALTKALGMAEDWSEYKQRDLPVMPSRLPEKGEAIALIGSKNEHGEEN